MELILEIRYPAHRRDVDDRVEAMLFLSPCTGSAIDEEGGDTVVRCYYPDAESRERGRLLLGSIPGVTIREIDEPAVDWLDRYVHSLEPVLIGSRFIVAPDASCLPPDGDRIAIVIPQERAFGTGTHESTALCMELLESLSIAGRSGLDIGTGSGILAIAMEKLGARPVAAFDRDLETFGILARNLKRNRIPRGHIVEFFGDIDAVRGSFEVITMNILPGVIIDLLPQVEGITAPGASLILSGILAEQSHEVVSATAAAGFELKVEAARGEWWAARLERSRR